MYSDVSKHLKHLAAKNKVGNSDVHIDTDILFTGQSNNFAENIDVFIALF